MCVSLISSSSWFQCKGDIKYSSRKQTYVDIAYTLYQKGTKKFDIEGAVNQARNMVLGTLYISSILYYILCTYDPSALLFPISFDKCDSNFDKTTRTQVAHNSFSEMKFEVTKAKNL